MSNVAEAFHTPRFGPDYDAHMVTAIGACSAAIARLDARFSVSPVATAWFRRAAWQGYATALFLQSMEIDEIDVFSWGCGLQLPGRVLRPTNLDPFDRFADWQQVLTARMSLKGPEALPATRPEPDGAQAHPPLIRALERLRQDARSDASIAAWLALPLSLRDLALCGAPLPCLTGGGVPFRRKRQPDQADWLAVLRRLESSAVTGLERMHTLERLTREAQRAIAASYRPGLLPRLLALAAHRPLLSPTAVAAALEVTLAGASKLLERGVEAGLVIEITKRRSWRQFLTLDVATELGFVGARQGRPKAEPPALIADREFAGVIEAFDAEMAAIDQLLGKGRG